MELMGIFNCLECLFSICLCCGNNEKEEYKQMNHFIILQNNGTYKNIKCMFCNQDFCHKKDLYIYQCFDTKKFLHFKCMKYIN